MHVSGTAVHEQYKAVDADVDYNAAGLDPVALHTAQYAKDQPERALS